MVFRLYNKWMRYVYNCHCGLVISWWHSRTSCSERIYAANSKQNSKVSLPSVSGHCILSHLLVAECNQPSVSGVETHPCCGWVDIACWVSCWLKAFLRSQVTLLCHKHEIMSWFVSFVNFVVGIGDILNRKGTDL